MPLSLGSVVAVCTPAPPALTAESHTDGVESGWLRSDCFSCHSLDECYGAEPGDREPDCVECHGYNGARNYYHLVEHDCYRVGCHASSHQGQGFEAPLDCRACHYQGGYEY